MPFSLPPFSIYCSFGDFDAAIDECRATITLNPNNAKAHVQLGITLMAKQEGRAAAIALREAILLDPELMLAHYSLGSAQYSLGHLTAAIQSYRRARDRERTIRPSSSSAQSANWEDFHRRQHGSNFTRVI